MDVRDTLMNRRAARRAYFHPSEYSQILAAARRAGYTGEDKHAVERYIIDKLDITPASLDKLAKDTQHG